jgi:demethylspheroidene O-methyltransferase
MRTGTLAMSWQDRWLAWRERLATWRDRLIADPGFQRRAASLPFARAIARRRARGLFDIVAGFVYSQVLLACVQLRLFEILADGAQPLDLLAARFGMTREAAQRLLDAAVALQLVERRGDARETRYGLGPLGAPMVGNHAVVAMVEHHAALYADLADPVALLRGQRTGGALAAYWPYATAPAPDALPRQRVAEYSALMSASQPLVADDVLDAYPIAQHRCLLDVGGGQGTFLAAAAQRARDLQLMLFDLPPVAELARERLAAQGLADRARAVGGDFLKDALPRGADVVSLVRVLYDHDDTRVAVILRAVHDALPSGGTLLVAEPMADTPGARAMGDAYFGFYTLAMGRGQPRSAKRLAALLQQAGFERVRLVPTRMPLQVGLLQAHKPTHPPTHEPSSARRET